MAKILLVEDQEVLQAMIQMRLESAGHEVNLAGNGRECLDLVEKDGEHDLVLMDLHMPVMDGHEATRALRARGYTRKVIALTASVFADNQNQAREAGCDDVITKPIGDDFESVIEKILEGPE